MMARNAAHVVSDRIAKGLERFFDEHRADAIVLEQLEKHAAVGFVRHDVRARHAPFAGAQGFAQIVLGIAAELVGGEQLLGTLFGDFTEHPELALSVLEGRHATGFQ